MAQDETAVQHELQCITQNVTAVQRDPQDETAIQHDPQGIAQDETAIQHVPLVYHTG